MPKHRTQRGKPGNATAGPDTQERTGNSLSFRKLYQSALFTVHDYQCNACRSGPAAEEHSEVNSIVLMRRGAFSRHFGRRNGPRT